MMTLPVLPTSAGSIVIVSLVLDIVLFDRLNSPIVNELPTEVIFG